MTAPARVPWYRVPVVWLLIAIPLLAVVGGFTTLWLAVVSYDGLVVDDYYRRGKEINRVLDRDRAAAERGLRALVHIDAGRGEARIALAGLAAPPERLHVQLLHATRAGYDRESLSALDAAGEYRASWPDLAPGHYYLQLAADDWRLLGSLHVPGDERVEIVPAVEHRPIVRADAR
ncbi:MAG TPA: FixH family protein [Burkholderiales bacterium]